MQRRLALVVVALAAGCSSSGNRSSKGTGGALAAGGATTSASGGSNSTGGTNATGGTQGTGGSVVTGGVVGAGGALATGGSAASGGNSAPGSDASATGGAGGKDAALDRAGGGTGGADVPAAADLPEARPGDSRDQYAEAAPVIDAGARMRVAIPLYIYPGGDNEWAAVAKAGTAVSYIIANAGDPGGPGLSADPAYATAIASAHTAGQLVLGYVDTNFAERALADAQAEVNQWYAFYPQIDGIFVDQTPDGADRIASYYQALSEQIRGKPGAHVVIINPGQPSFAEGYMALADVAMSFENPYGSISDGYGPGQYSAPAWMGKYPADRFWHVILEVADATAMRSVLDLARTRNVGHVYVTNYADPPAYARLPSFFADEIAAVGR
jgi:hypothetical protein